MEAARAIHRTGGARAASLLAWSLAALSVALPGVQLLLFMLARSADVPESWDVNSSFIGQLAGGLFLGGVVAVILETMQQERASM